MSTAVEDRLLCFARALLERNGALVDEPENAAALAILPPPLARVLRLPEELQITTQAAPGPHLLCANLATDFLERVDTLVARCPNAAGLRLDNLYLKKSPMDDPVARFFSFPTARVRVSGARPVRLEYHCWYFLAAIDSEDRWEELLTFHINSASNAQIDLPDPLSMVDARPAAAPFADSPPDLRRARRVASIQAADHASPFLARLEARLERDRRRIREYYGALLDETSPAHSRAAQTPEKLAEKRRAVDIEQRRRLLELDQRYALRLHLDPVALIALNMPVLEVELEVSRRPHGGVLRVYWNPLRKELEPAVCSHCQNNITSIHFDSLLHPVCAACERQK